MEVKLNLVGVRAGVGGAGYFVVAEVVECLGAHLDGCDGWLGSWTTYLGC